MNIEKEKLEEQFKWEEERKRQREQLAMALRHKTEKSWKYWEEIQKASSVPRYAH